MDAESTALPRVLWIVRVLFTCVRMNSSPYTGFSWSLP